MRAGRLWGMGFAAFLLLGAICRGQDSLNVSKTGEIAWGIGQATHLALTGDYAFVAVASLDSAFELYAVNIGSSFNPEIAGSCWIPGSSEGISIWGDYAYMAAGPAGLRIVDISNPNNPSEAGSYDSPGYTTSVVVRDTLAYVTDFTAFYIVNVSNPALPLLVGQNDSVDALAGIALQDNYAFLLFGFAQSVVIFDVADPAIPYTVGNYAIGGPPGDISISSGFAFTTNNFGGVHVADVSNPLQPVSLATFPLTGLPQAIDAMYNFAMVGHGASGFSVFDVMNPNNVQMVGYYDTPGFANDVAMRDFEAFVADGDYFGIYDCYLAFPVEPSKPLAPPSSFVLRPPHPNPFNARTVLSFQLPVASLVKLEVFDINGRSVGARRAAPANGVGFGEFDLQYFPAGTHQIPFDGSDLPSGIYLARITAGDWSAVRKMVLMK